MLSCLLLGKMGFKIGSHVCRAIWDRRGELREVMRCEVGTNGLENR
jgi:hypothetical protein